VQTIKTMIFSVSYNPDPPNTLRIHLCRWRYRCPGLQRNTCTLSDRRWTGHHAPPTVDRSDGLPRTSLGQRGTTGGPRRVGGPWAGGYSIHAPRWSGVGDDPLRRALLGRILGAGVRMAGCEDPPDAGGPTRGKQWEQRVASGLVAVLEGCRRYLWRRWLPTAQLPCGHCDERVARSAGAGAQTGHRATMGVGSLVGRPPAGHTDAQSPPILW